MNRISMKINRFSIRTQIIFAMSVVVLLSTIVVQVLIVKLVENISVYQLKHEITLLSDNISVLIRNELKSSDFNASQKKILELSALRKQNDIEINIFSISKKTIVASNTLENIGPVNDIDFKNYKNVMLKNKANYLTGVDTSKSINSDIKKQNSPDYYIKRNIPYMNLTVPINNLNNYIIDLKMSMNSINILINKIKIIMNGILGGEMILILMVLLILMNNRIFEKLNDLIEKMRVVENESLNGEAIPVDKNDEIAVVIKEFNIMSKRLIGNKIKTQREFFIDLIEVLMVSLEERDFYTKGHSNRVSDISIRLGRYMDFSEESIYNLHLASILHDIGKIGISDEILNKKEKLTDEEYSLIKEHPLKAVKILDKIKNNQIDSCIDIIKYHHERYDGNGYPEKLKGEEIPYLSRLISIVDSYDAMTSDRIYRKGMDKNMALEEIKLNKKKQFDPLIADKFIEMMSLI